MVAKKKPARITRSISFEKVLLDYCKREARRQNRTVNWVVNESVRKDLSNASSPAGDSAAA